MNITNDDHATRITFGPDGPLARVMQNTRAAETKAVKQALQDADLPCWKVCHGTGTAWNWLGIYMGRDSTRAQRDQAIAVAQRVTGRHGDYDGEINVYQQ